MRAFAQTQSQSQEKISSAIVPPNMETSAPGEQMHPILHLQRTIGNQAVQRLLRAKAEGHKAPINLQAKLAVNIPGDIYEQEADHVAERVMNMAEPKLQRACACGGACHECQNKQEADEHLQTKSEGTNDFSGTEAPPIVNEVLHSSGQPLDPSTLEFMESRFGHDFSQVRVHNDSLAAESAKAVNAHAFTVGNDIVFGAAQYAPDSKASRRLLAHELVHVVQQMNGPSRLAHDRLRVTGERGERQPAGIAHTGLQGLPSANVTLHGRGIQRQTPPAQENRVCGPDITADLRDAITSTVAAFIGWRDERKQAACDRIISPALIGGGQDSWDILDLNNRNNGWIRADYSPTCATPASSVPCERCDCSVQVQGDCYYSGTVNYVIYGHMCKLCHDYYARLRSTRAQDYTPDEMVEWINTYKSGAPNYYPALTWALAGYGAWLPGSPAPSRGDRSRCAPTCPTPNRHSPFQIWFGWWTITA